MAEYRVHLLRDDFTRLTTLKEFVSLEFSKQVNAVGAAKIVVSANLPTKWLAVDRVIEIYRSGPGVPEYRAWSGLLRKWSWDSSSDGSETLSMYAVDWNELLKRRVIAHPRESSGADKSGPADDLCKAYVRENLASEAGSNRAAPGLTVQADKGAAPSVTGSFAWTNLLQALQQLVDDATDLGEQTLFWIEHVGVSSLEFRTNVGFQKKDHTTVDNPLYFSEALGNLSDPVVTYDYMDEINYVYVTGQGEGEEQVTEEVSQSEWVNSSRFGRRESYRSAADVENTSEMRSDGNEEIASHAPVRRITGTVKDIEFTRLGRDWSFGDKVYAQHESGTFPVVVAALDVNVSDREEQVRASLNDQIGKQYWNDPVSGIFYVIHSLRREVGRVSKATKGSGFNLDFTSPLWDTVEECNKLGLRFSGVNDPFPTAVRDTVSGSWVHFDGRGWQPLSTTTDQGPAIIIPITQGAEFELLVGVDLRYASTAHKVDLFVGYLDASNWSGGHGRYYDNSTSYVRYQARLETSDGDGTYTTRYTGTALDGAVERTIGFRLKSATMGIWDDEIVDWSDYKGTLPSGAGLAPAAAFIQVSKFDSTTMSEVYISSLKLKYLSRSG